MTEEYLDWLWWDLLIKLHNTVLVPPFTKQPRLSTHHCFCKFYSMYAAKKLEAFRKINLSVSLLMSHQTWYWWVAMISIQYTGQWCWTGFSLNIVHCSSCALKPDDKRVGCALAAFAFAWYCNHKSCHTHIHTLTQVHTLAQPSSTISDPFLSSGLLDYWFLQSLTQTGWQTTHLLLVPSEYLTTAQEDCVSICMCVHLCVTVCGLYVCLCGIEQQYQLQSVVHISLP